MGDSDEEEVPRARPPPPPPRRPPGASAGGSGNLSNHDFRKMVLETPRRGSGGGGGGGGGGGRPRHRQGEGEGGKTPGPKAGKKPWSKKGAPGAGEGGGDEDGVTYRDRAKERREDINPDYKATDAVAERISVLSAVAPPGSTSFTTGDAHKQAIEKSKFLGGDVEHTHLVKGLDFALLQKVRSEIERKAGEQGDAKGADAAQGQEGPSSVSAAGAKGRSNEPAASFRTTMGKNVYGLLVRPPAPKTSEIFLPGRTTFVFDMDDEFRQEIPTTVLRSKADCPPPEDLISLSVDSSVLERIDNIMSYLRLGTTAKVHKKKKKKEDSAVLVSGLIPPKSFASNPDAAVSGAPAVVQAHEEPPRSRRSSANGLPHTTSGQATSTAPGAGAGAGVGAGVGAGAGSQGRAMPPPPPPREPAGGGEEDEEDIFAEAGKDYVVTGKEEKPGGAKGHGQQSMGGAGLFAEPSGVRDAAGAYPPPPLPPPPPPPPDMAPMPPPEPSVENGYMGAYTQAPGPAYPPADGTWAEYPPPPPEEGPYPYPDASQYPGAQYPPALYPEPYADPQYAAGQYVDGTSQYANPEAGSYLQGTHGDPGWMQAPGMEGAEADLPMGVSAYQGPAGIGAGEAGGVRLGGKDPASLTQAEKERGLGSVFKRFNEAEESARRKAAPVSEKDPSGVPASYAECYPDYNEGYAGEVVESDEEGDMEKMDIGAKTKARLHRWDFDTEEEWSEYNASKEILPSEAFQYGIKAADGRKSKKALKDKDQKLNNELNQINKIIDRRRKERAPETDGYPEDAHGGGKKSRT